MSKKKEQKTTGQEFKDALELIVKRKVNMKKTKEEDKYTTYTTFPKLREDYKKRGVTEACFRHHVPILMPKLSKEEIDMFAQIIFRPTKEDLLRDN